MSKSSARQSLLLVSMIMILLLVITGCAKSQDASSKTDGPKTVVESFLQDINRGDLAAGLGLMSDNVVFQQDPPGIKLEGKKQLETALRNIISWNRKITALNTPKIDGDKVSLSAEMTGDDFRILGIEKIHSNYEFVVSNGRITLFSTKPDAGEWGSIAKQTAGSIGINIERLEQGIRIREVMKNSPAERAGLGAGDLITAIDGIKCTQMREGEDVLRIKGPVGSKVRLIVIKQAAQNTVGVEVDRVDLSKNAS